MSVEEDPQDISWREQGRQTSIFWRQKSRKESTRINLQMKLSYFWQVVQKSEDCLAKEIIQSTVPWSTAQGRPKMTEIDDIKSWTRLCSTGYWKRQETEVDRTKLPVVRVWPILGSSMVENKTRQITIQSNNNAKQQHATHENSDRM